MTSGPHLPSPSADVASILIVDDHPANLLALETVLGPIGQRIVRAASGQEAVARVREQEFAVILLDVMMPGIDGLGTADLIRAEERGGDVPIIFMTAGDIPALEGYAHGAVDVLRKPLDRDVVRAKVAVFVELFLAREQIRRQAVRLEAQERDAAARSAALLNASLDGVVGMDHHGRITEFNRAAEVMFGYRRPDVLGAPLEDLLLPPRHRDAYRRGVAAYLATGESPVLDTRIELTAVRADSTEFPIELAVGRVLTEGPATFLAYVSDLTERKRAERATAFLAGASEAFAGSLDYEVTLQTVVRLAVPHVADWCAVDMLDEQRAGAFVQLALAHVNPAKMAFAKELRQRYPLDPDALQGVPNVVRTGLSELYTEVSDAMVQRAARDAEHLRILQEVGLKSVMIVPIVTRGRSLGAITFVAAESLRRYGPSDLAMAEELARRAAMAIENARLYRARLRAEERNRFLAEATAALGASLDYATTLDRVVGLAVPTIADLAAIYRLEDDGVIRLMVLAGRDAQQEAFARELDALLPLRIEEQRPLARVIRTGRSEMLAEVPGPLRELWSPTSRADELVRLLATRSYMAVPVVVRGRVFGATALTTSLSGRNFDAADVALAEELARRAGLAIENAELYSEAQNANRLKDEFLATVSHELRTPLTAILGWIHVLRSGRSERAAHAIDTIERNAHAQARIIDDLLDVSQVVTGKLRLQLEAVDLCGAVHAAIEMVEPMAQAKGIELTTYLDPNAGPTAGDAGRLQQVAWNLLSNAIKFTPSGGRVEVRLEARQGNAYLRVSDDGQGVRADFLPHLFERFRQGDSGPTRAHGGLGLGLAIVRYLVELHGGHVVAESQGDGRGATFTVVLPLRALVSNLVEPPASSSGAGQLDSSSV